MPYGILPYMILLATQITQTEHDGLVAHSDVYAFPENLDQPVTDATIDTFMEGINIPTNWLIPSTTYREFLRMMAGLFQFMQRYNGISTGHSLFDGGLTLDSNWNALTTQQKSWFNDTVHSFGYSQNVTGNPKLRTLAKQAGDLWGNKPFYMGGYEF